MSNVGRWDWYYRHKPQRPFGYSASDAFAIGAEWLAGCEQVADWGCGGGMMRRHIEPERYIGVDGSRTWAVDVVADLSSYTEQTDGIFVRNVLEHNYDWSHILHNAVAAFRRRMALVLFTPFHEGGSDDHELRYEKRYRVPTLSLKRSAVEEHFDGLTFELREVPAESFYGCDHVYLIER